jgi:hypothetical protein
MAISRVTLSSITQGFPKSRSFLDGNSAYLPPSFESIATVTGTGSSATLTLSSIPSTYKHLQLRFVGALSTSSTGRISFNSDTTYTNYRTHYLENYSSAVGAGTYQSATYPGVALGVNTGFVSPFSMVIDLLDYANTSKNKTLRSINGVDVNGPGGAITLTSGLWLSTSAINSITLTATSGFWSTASIIALYGIKG